MTRSEEDTRGSSERRALSGTISAFASTQRSNANAKHRSTALDNPTCFRTNQVSRKKQKKQNIEFVWLGAQVKLTFIIKRGWLLHRMFLPVRPCSMRKLASIRSRTLAAPLSCSFSSNSIRRKGIWAEDGKRGTL